MNVEMFSGFFFPWIREDFFQVLSRLCVCVSIYLKRRPMHLDYGDPLSLGESSEAFDLMGCIPIPKE